MGDVIFEGEMETLNRNYKIVDVGGKRFTPVHLYLYSTLFNLDFNSISFHIIMYLRHFNINNHKLNLFVNLNISILENFNELQTNSKHDQPSLIHHQIHFNINNHKLNFLNSLDISILEHFNKLQTNSKQNQPSQTHHQRH